ncbi:hypothetical protein I546_1570 [Mycobacterium kansasii 732]|nr:hypothetical protein I546_1570 [Mycobacterium kansasii 732]
MTRNIETFITRSRMTNDIAHPIRTPLLAAGLANFDRYLLGAASGRL